MLRRNSILTAILLSTVWLANPTSNATGQTTSTVEASASISIQRGDLDGKRVVFLGDSITANGTHIGFVETILRRKYPKQTFDFISAGLPSETTSGLTEPDHPFPRPCVLERLDRVLEKANPDIVIACYGMNDGIYHPASEERTKAFHDGMNTLVTKCQQSGAKVVLLTPPAFDAQSAKGIAAADAPLFGYKTPYENYSDVMTKYSKWVLSREDVVAIDVNTPLVTWLKERRTSEPDFKSGDGVHPNQVGYMALAIAILKGMGEDLPDATPQVAFDRITKDKIYSAIESRRKKRGAGWMRHTGYIRGPKNQQPEPLGSTEDDAKAAAEEIEEML